MDQIAITKLTQDGEAFVYNSWLRTYKQSSHFARRISAKIYFPRHHAVIERILARPSTTVFTATFKDDPSVILGYAVIERVADYSILHFAYTKLSFRRMGILKALLKAAAFDLDACVYTHRTFDVESLQEKHPGMQYDPYLI